MSKATITGKTGPAITATAIVLSNVENISLNTISGVISVAHDGGKITDVDVSAATTFTLTVTSGVYSLTVS